jgi:hypothetical protein
MDYVLEDLLRVRIHRENTARNAVRAKKQAFENAARLVSRRKEELTEYTSWRINTENTLYGSVKNKLVSVKKLDDLKQKILLLREKETFLEKELFEAKNARQAAEKELAEARAVHKTSIREMKKIEEHKNLWMADMLKEQERSREKEMEEFQKQLQPPNSKFDDDENF